MAQKIESDKLLVKDVFQRWYRIPEYQRPYVWETDNVIELLDDVYHARNSNPDAQYFLGSMVLKKTEKNDGESKYEEFDLLDGQQRLTTLFLITAVVRDLTTDKIRQKSCRDSIFQMANPDDNIPERMRIVFDIRDKVRDFVDKYIKEEGGTTKEDELSNIVSNDKEDISIRNMSNAILKIRKYFQNGKSIDEFFPYLRSNVLMIYVSAEELEDAFHLFTVMNNRGIKLRNSDILKAQNLSKVKVDAKRIDHAKKWEATEEYFGEDFDNFLSHLRTILVKQKAATNLLKEFEDNIYNPKEYDWDTETYKSKPALLLKGEDTFKFIERYFKNYTDLFENDNYSITNSFEVHNYINLMRRGFESDLWIAPLLRYYDSYKTNKLLDFIKKLDNKFSSDWIIGLSPTDRIYNMNQVIDAIDKSKDADEILNSEIFNISKNSLLRILSGDVYGRRHAKYLLLKLDLSFQGHTTKFNPPPTISIEHILPQNPYSDSTWVANFSDEQRQKWTNRIGNLVLISRRKNSSQSNYDYDKKKEKYFKNNVELFSNSVRIYNQYQTWTLADLLKNHEETLEKICEEYELTFAKEEWAEALNSL